MVGPPYLIGPESALYQNANGTVRSAYDAVNLDGGHTFCADCPFQLRAFGGVEFARIGQTMTGLFQSADGTDASGYTNNSLFTGVGPRLGLKGQYAFGDFQFIGEFAGAGLIGTARNSINFLTNSPVVGVNNQALTSPNATQVIPSIDARLATAYTFPPSDYGQFKIELGYQAAIYFDVVSQYALTQVTDDGPARGSLPGNGATFSKQLHGPGALSDRQLAVLAGSLRLLGRLIAPQAGVCLSKTSGFRPAFRLSSALHSAIGSRGQDEEERRREEETV